MQKLSITMPNRKRNLVLMVVDTNGGPPTNELVCLLVEPIPTNKILTTAT